MDINLDAFVLVDVLVLLISTPSEISILSYSNIYNSYKHSPKNLEDNIYHPLEKPI